MRNRILILLSGLCLSISSCIIVSDDGCGEGNTRCDGEFVQQCISDDWVDIEDCFDLCGGTCGETDFENVCVC